MVNRMAIRIKINDVAEYVEVSEEMLKDYELFSRHVLQTFGFDQTQAASLFLFDQDNFQIPVNLFPVIIPQFVNPSVYLKVVFNLHEVPGLDMNLEDYLKKNGCKSIFLLAEEATKNGTALDVKNIHYLAEKLVHFMDYREATGDKIDAQQAADSLVRLMPCIKMETLYYGRKGVLYNKLYYRRYGKSKKGEKLAKENDDEQNQESEVQMTNVTEGMQQLTVADELSCLLFFKTCVIERDKEILKIKLQQTINLRETTIRKKETKFIESFPFYFVAPDLILYDYSIRFNNENYLMEKWPNLISKTFGINNRGETEECINMGFDNETTTFILLLRSLSMRKTFAANVEKFIIYSDDVNGNPEDLIDKKTIHPYIIAIGLSKDKISNYYIDIEHHLIPVPIDFTFTKTFDMFLKCHKIFHIEYSSVIIKMMHFVDYYIFENTQNEEIDVTITMRKISDKLLKN